MNDKSDSLWSCLVWYDQRRKRHFFNINKILHYAASETAEYIADMKRVAPADSDVCKVLVVAPTKAEALAKMFMNNVVSRLFYKDGVTSESFSFSVEVPSAE